MNRSDFTGLPLSLALGLLYDAFPALAEKLATMDAPQPVRAPRFDARIYRKDGYQWASEMSLNSLQYWQGKFATSSDPKYVEKDAKRARELGFWIAWRRVEPNAVWSGKRNDEQVTASAPHEKPFIYAREPRNDAPPSPAMGRAEEPSFDDPLNDPIPF